MVSRLGHFQVNCHYHNSGGGSVRGRGVHSGDIPNEKMLLQQQWNCNKDNCTLVTGRYINTFYVQFYGCEK